MKPSYVLDFIAFTHNRCSCMLVESTQMTGKDWCSLPNRMVLMQGTLASQISTAPHRTSLFGLMDQCRSLDARLANIEVDGEHMRPRTLTGDTSKTSPGGSLQMQTIDQTVQDSWQRHYHSSQRPRATTQQLRNEHASALHPIDPSRPHLRPQQCTTQIVTSSHDPMDSTQVAPLNQWRGWPPPAEAYRRCSVTIGMNQVLTGERLDAVAGRW